MAKEIDKRNSVRWLAAVYFKNVINKYWRVRVPSP